MHSIFYWQDPGEALSLELNLAYIIWVRALGPWVTNHKDIYVGKGDINQRN